VSDRGEDREARVLPDEFEEVFEHLRPLPFFREGSVTAAHDGNHATPHLRVALCSSG
jgi:hypothetical protein